MPSWLKRSKLNLKPEGYLHAENTAHGVSTGKNVVGVEVCVLILIVACWQANKVFNVWSSRQSFHLSLNSQDFSPSWRAQIIVSVCGYFFFLFKIRFYFVSYGTAWFVFVHSWYPFTLSSTTTYPMTQYPTGNNALRSGGLYGYRRMTVVSADRSADRYHKHRN